MNKTHLYILIVALFLVSATACFRDDLKDLTMPNWNPDIAIPLVQTRFLATDIIDNLPDRNNVDVDSTGLVSFVYAKKNVVSIPAEDFLKIPDLSFLATDNSTLLNFTLSSGDILDKLELSEGQFVYDLEVDQLEDVQVTITIPDATKAGKPFEKIINLIYAGINPIQTTDTIDLAGYILDLTQIGDTIVSLAIEYEAVLNSTGEKVPVKKFVGIWEHLKFSYAEGLFALKDFKFKIDTLKLGFLKNWLDGSVSMEDPNIEITVKNNYGLPFSLFLTNFNAANELITVPVTGEIFADSVYVNFPDDSLRLNADTTHIIVDGENSNLENVLTIAPDKLTYGLSFGTTPVLDSLVLINRISDESRLSVDIKLELPFQLRIDNLSLRDTFDLKIDNIEEVDYAKFKLVTENSFPLNARIQVYFATESYYVLDSLFTTSENLLVSGEVNEDGVVINPSRNETLITVNHENLRNIYDARKIIVKAHLLSTNNGESTVQFLTTYGIDMQLGVVTNLSYQ